jgi:DNA-binding transcriptional regulator LsrR (DeoR family)
MAWEQPGPAHADSDRNALLAHVAEMYYLGGKDQSAIAGSIGVTRSMVSRMLKEAHKKGLVEIRIHHPKNERSDLSAEMISEFGLHDAFVLNLTGSSNDSLINRLGDVGAHLLMKHLQPHMILGIAWGSTISATVDSIVQGGHTLPIRIVQMVGALGARLAEYDGHFLVQRLSERLGGEAYYLNAPFLCHSAEIARSLEQTWGIRETIEMRKQVEIALLGVGSINPTHSSFYLAGYVPIEHLTELEEAGAIGDVCGINFDREGSIVGQAFAERLVTIRVQDLLAIPLRLGVAGGPGKVEPIFGALRGGLINMLVTDSVTACAVLNLAKKSA